MSAIEKDIIHYSDWLVLLGFFDEQEALQYIQRQGLRDFSKDEWLTKVREAKSSTEGLTGRRELQPTVENIEKLHPERFSKLRSEATFAEHLIGVKSAQFCNVGLENLRCFQIQLNMEYLNKLNEQVPEIGQEESLLKFCLPTREEKGKTEVVIGNNQGTNTFLVSTDNLDLRVVGSAQFEDGNTGRQILGFAFGFGLPQISVVKYKGLYLLKNGYHRAYTLLKKGHKIIPCLLVETDSFQSTGAQAPGFFSVDMLMSDKGPLLSDFNSNAAVVVPRRRLRAILTVHSEIQMVPS